MQQNANGVWILAEAQPTRPDFKLPPAQPQSKQNFNPPTPGPPPSPQPGTTTFVKPVTAGPYDNLTPTSLTIGAVVLLVLTVAFIFIGRSMRGHLITRKASPVAASSAGWALFAFLMSAAATVVLGVIGNLWTVLSFAIPMAALCVVTLILFAILYGSATKSAR